MSAEMRNLGSSDGDVAYIQNVTIVQPGSRKNSWWRERYPIWTGFYVFCVLVFVVLSFATTLVDVTYLSGNALLKFGIAWWVVLGFLTVAAALAYFMGMRNLVFTDEQGQKWRLHEIDRYERHMAFWILFFISLFGAINIGVYYGEHGSTNVKNDAMALIDFETTFAMIAATFPILIIVISRWGFHVSNPMIQLDATIDHALASQRLLLEKQSDVNQNVLPSVEHVGEISVRTRIRGEDPQTDTETHHKLLNQETPTKYRGFYWTAAVLSFFSLIAFGLMWVNTLSGITFLAGDAARPWLIVYSIVEGVLWLILLIFYLWCLFGRLQLSLRVHTQIQAYFWGMTFAILLTFGGLLVFELDIGDFNVNNNPVTYLDFKMMQVFATIQFFFTIWITSRLLMMPAEFAWVQITTAEYLGAIVNVYNPNEATGSAEGYSGRRRTKV